VLQVWPSLHRNVQRFRGGLVFRAHGLCVSLNSRLPAAGRPAGKILLVFLKLDKELVAEVFHGSKRTI